MKYKKPHFFTHFAKAVWVREVTRGKKAEIANLKFSSFLDEPMVALCLVVLGLVALLLSVINFVQAVYLY